MIALFAMDKTTVAVIAAAAGSVAILSMIGTRKGRKFATTYANHSALNLGQAARDVRYIYDHPDAEKVSQPGTPLYLASSITSRIPSLASNLYYTALPPQLHHSEEELSNEGDELQLKNRFLQGYDPWTYSKRV